ncbi:DUF1326 domain-containing protein [Winogradskya humida]|uniref:DUF1326 domain-containing protein n=1 Tax=Winogradskya humida TaxID=113566 RepID=A0ABQ3ZIA1_9ACTN|nr:DUF1326 domain-containing protein [Actinoplanes humidus]GIE18331.1 hypothetical protein Ahu01nite_014330 [Actinoplanes humidus]
MTYSLTGVFTEACDCTLVCPCWLDDAPDEDHCTGLFAWQLDDGARIDGVGVGGLSVVSVSTHSGGRRAGSTSTAIFVSATATDEQFALLTEAFSGRLDGPLADLADVSGAVLTTARARIEVTADAAGWHIYVGLPQKPAVTGTGLVEVTGSAAFFLDEDEPLTLTNTALGKELGSGAVVAHRTDALAVRVPALPGAYLDVRGRSAMRGRFQYSQVRTRVPE